MSITIPEKVYVGFQGRRAEDEVPLGFMTPYTDDVAGEKRRKTVDDWAAGYGRAKTFNSVTIDNAPMYGFRLGRAIRRSGYMGSGASYVRIEDPRGFELEISIENLVALLENVAMERCEFLGELVWGRVSNSTKNILIAVNSDEFKSAVKTKSAVAAAKTIKDFKIGDTIESVTGEVGVYMGTLFGVVDGWKEPEPMASKKPVLRITNEDGSVKYLGFVDLKGVITKEYDGDKLTTQDSENEIVAAQQANQYICEYRGNNSIIAWFSKKPVVNSVSVAKTHEQMQNLFDQDTSAYSYFNCRISGKDYSIRRTDDGTLEATSRSYSYGSKAVSIDWDTFLLQGHNISNGANTVTFF